MIEEEIPLSLLMIDIDNFKNFNDTFGHQEGDKVLKEIAKTIITSSRKEDLIARYGGEEFTVILPHADKNEAFIIAERLRENIHNIENEKKLTVSIGISSFPQDAYKKEELIEYADQALYKAKHEGKDRVCAYFPK